MQNKKRIVGAALAAGLALAACSQPAPPPAPPPAPVATTVIDDQTLSQIKRGQTNMAQVSALIGAPTVRNFQAGHEIWIYQGVVQAPGAPVRTVTVQFDDRGVVRNIGDQPVN
jgi:outer membrane protein assembly factor BamE (lipoprotein component of BamABCDE complex)